MPNSKSQNTNNKKGQFCNFPKPSNIYDLFAYFFYFFLPFCSFSDICIAPQAHIPYHDIGRLFLALWPSALVQMYFSLITFPPSVPFMKIVRHFVSLTKVVGAGWSLVCIFVCMYACEQMYGDRRRVRLWDLQEKLSIGGYYSYLFSRIKINKVTIL